MTFGNVSAIRLAPLRQNIAEVIRDLLLDGRFRPGEEISDSGLAAEFQVSRGPVREALFLLAEQGLVQHMHNHGFRVPELKMADLQQIAQVRLPLEALALALAKTRVTTNDVKDLGELWRTLLGDFRRGGSRACARAELAFHSRVWDMSGNPWLSAALRRICIPYFVYVSAFRLVRNDHSEELMTEMHQRYIDFLAGENSDTAEACVAFHLDLGRSGVAASLE